MKEKYDVVVIGAGIGGLTCGAFLAKKGLSVLVAEQHTEPGGYCTSFQRKGFTFDAGIEFIVGAEKGGMLAVTLEELGLKNEIEFIELTPPTRIIGKDYDVPFTPLERLADELKRMFPKEGPNIDAFVQDCRYVTSQLMALAEPAPDLLDSKGKMGLMIKFLFKSPKLRKYGGKSFRQALLESFKDPKLIAILGSAPDHSPTWAASSQMLVMGYPGFQYPKGGFQALTNVLKSGLLRYGGELALKTMATSIFIDEGRAAGIQLSDGTIISSRYVVSNVDGRQTFLKLIGEQHLSPKFVRELKETQLGTSFFLVSLGVDMDLRAMGFNGTTIVYNRSDSIDEIYGGDPEKCSLWIMMHSLREPSQALEGKATMQIIAPFPYSYLDHWKRETDGTRGKEYVSLKEEIANKLINSAEMIVSSLSKHIVCKDIATPLTFERYTLNSEGAGHGWFPAPGAKLRSQITPIKNLYQAGHWTFPGFGIFAVALSGRNAAKLVLKDLERS
jgi:all-trans-retinol 13,14-reductase